MRWNRDFVSDWLMQLWTEARFVSIFTGAGLFWACVCFTKDPVAHSILYINCHCIGDQEIVGTNWIKPCCLRYAVAKQVTLHVWHHNYAVCHSGSLLPLPDPLNSLQGRTPEQTDPLWSALARWLLTSADKNRKHSSGHDKPQWGCLIGRWLSYCCPGSPDPGSVQGLGQDGWINNVCGSNVRNNESTGLVDTPNAGKYSVSGLSLWRETNLTRLPHAAGFTMTLH